MVWLSRWLEKKGLEGLIKTFMLHVSYRCLYAKNGGTHFDWRDSLILSPLRYICYLPAGRSVWLKPVTEGLKLILTQTLVATIWKVLSSRWATFFLYTNLPFSFFVKLTRNFKLDLYRRVWCEDFPVQNKPWRPSLKTNKRCDSICLRINTCDL